MKRRKVWVSIVAIASVFFFNFSLTTMVSGKGISEMMDDVPDFYESRVKMQAAKTMFSAYNFDQMVLGYCVQNKEQHEYIEHLKNKKLWVFSEENAHSSLKAFVAAQVKALDWSGCQKKIIYAKNLTGVQENAHYRILFVGGDVRGYRVTGFCTTRPGIRRALLRETADFALKTKDIPKYYREFAETMQTQIFCAGEFVPNFINDPRAAASPVVKIK